jgi:hypothetical protein
LVQTADFWCRRGFWCKAQEFKWKQTSLRKVVQKALNFGIVSSVRIEDALTARTGGEQEERRRWPRP